VPPRVLVWDSGAVAADLVAALRDLLPPGAVEAVTGSPARETGGHARDTGTNVVHVVAPDDGSDLPMRPGSEAAEDAATAESLSTYQPALVAVVLDGCYRPGLAEPIAQGGTPVIALPGRIGRGQATEFALAWYAGLAGTPAKPPLTPHEAFNQAMLETRFHRLPTGVQPQFLAHGSPQGTVFRAPSGAQPQQVTLWYGTNRRPRAGTAGTFGPEPDDALHLGSCVVRVPDSVPVGKARARRARGSSGPRTYGMEALEALDHGQFLSRLRDALSKHGAGERSILAYVHGYRVHFTEAATRAAQLHSDLNNPGQMAFFSWPSAGSADKYFADEDSIQHAERYLLRFLDLLCRDTGAEKVNVIAHSMGNRAMLRIAMRIAADTPDARGIRLGHVFLAAADVSRRFFLAEAAAYPTACDGVTCYVSSRDRALKSSGIIHTGDRAGLTPPLTLLDGIDTIDASETDLTFLGHGYYAEARPVLTDMHNILRGQHRPESRFGLKQATNPEGRPYWRFRP
jgi:esterase/lipase superfamily enzyme